LSAYNVNEHLASIRVWDDAQGSERTIALRKRGYSSTEVQRLGRHSMTIEQRLSYLRIALTIAGIMCFCVYPLMLVWPSGWTWHMGHSDYPMMIVGIYATLGVFLILAARDPMKHLSLIWFAVWSSVVHGLIMAFQAVVDVGQHGHFLGDVPALFLIAIVLAVLTPRRRNAVGISTVA
jgi:FtsH-binding integral membrane protein